MLNKQELKQKKVEELLGDAYIDCFRNSVYLDYIVNDKFKDLMKEDIKALEKKSKEINEEAKLIKNPNKKSNKKKLKKLALEVAGVDAKIKEYNDAKAEIKNRTEVTEEARVLYKSIEARLNKEDFDSVLK